MRASNDTTNAARRSVTSWRAYQRYYQEKDSARTANHAPLSSAKEQCLETESTRWKKSSTGRCASCFVYACAPRGARFMRQRGKTCHIHATDPPTNSIPASRHMSRFKNMRQQSYARLEMSIVLTVYVIMKCALSRQKRIFSIIPIHLWVRTRVKERGCTKQCA